MMDVDKAVAFADVSDSIRDLLVNTYRAFNAREIETVLAVLHPDVKWANGMNGGFVHGRDAVSTVFLRRSICPMRVERSSR